MAPGLGKGSHQGDHPRYMRFSRHLSLAWEHGNPHTSHPRVRDRVSKKYPAGPPILCFPEVALASHAVSRFLLQ